MEWLEPSERNRTRRRLGSCGARVLRDPAELAAVRPGWRRLAQAHGATPMQDAPWCEAAAATVDAGCELAVVLVGDDQPRAIAPLARRNGHLEILGSERLAEPSDLLYANARALHELVDALAALRTPLLLRRLPAASPVVPALAGALRPAGRVLTRASGAHPAIALDERWLASEGRLAPRRAADLRRARRRAEALGGVEAELLRPAPEDVGALLDDAFAIEARSWKGAAGSALALDAPFAAFFRRYATALAAEGALRVAFLRIGGTRVAMHLCGESGHRLWLLKIGHDEAYARCSPGSLLLLDVVRDAAARGLTAVQMLGTDEPWTRMWTADAQPCATVAAYPPAMRSLAGAAHAAAELARRRRTARSAA